jgi:general secretion pathway protein H
MRARSKPEGFTLIEMIIVLVILSVMTALVVPRLTKSLSRMNLEGTVRRVASALRLARSLAVTEKVTYLALFDMNADSLTVTSYQQTPKEEDSPELEADRAVMPKVYILKDGIHLKEGVALNGESVTDGAFRMAFFPGGGTSGGKVVLGDDEGRSFSVSVDRIAGSVKINENGANDH